MNELHNLISYESIKGYNRTIYIIMSYRSPKINTCKTRQSEMANTSVRHMPVLGNVHANKAKIMIFFRDFISLLARVFRFLIDRATQEVPMKNI